MKKFLSITVGTVLLFAACKCNKADASSPKSNPDGSQGDRNSQTTSAYELAQTEPAVGINLGNAAPEIALKNPEGKVITLSSLKGKVVLIDFWASWCGPCRFENPSVVKAYKQYKDKKLKGGNGFTVYSVSLDMDMNAWKKAIGNDSLIWEYHVSDLKGWNNEAAGRYSVNGIPTNFLINGDGVIIDRNLRGEALLAAIEKLTK